MRMKIDPHPYRKLEKRILIYCINQTSNNIHKKILKDSIKTSKRLKGGFTEISMPVKMNYKLFIEYTENFIKNNFNDIIKCEYISVVDKNIRHAYDAYNKIRLSTNYMKTNLDVIETYFKLINHGI